MDINEILSSIKTGVFTNDDLNAIGQAVQFARRQLAHEVKREIFPGATVYFKDRYGSRIVGQVESIKIKNAVVSTTRGRYRVPCNMLEMS